MADYTVTVHLDIQGISDYVRQAPEAQEIVQGISERAANRMRAMVPVDTGHLRSRIRVREAKNGGRDVGVFDVPYALPVEMGHYTRSGSFVPAQPFVRPALSR